LLPCIAALPGRRHRGGRYHGGVDSIAGDSDHGYQGGTCDTALPIPHVDDFNYADSYATDPDMDFSGRQGGKAVGDSYQDGTQFGVLCCA